MSAELKGYLGYVKEFHKLADGDTFAKVEVSAHTMTSRQNTGLYDVKQLSVYW